MPKNKPSTTTKKTAQKKVKKTDYISAVGRRKTSIARVRLHQGQGEHLVNQQPVGKYFPGETNNSIFLAPFRALSNPGKFYVTVKVQGGGIKSQVQAVAHGIARALVKFDQSFKPVLKKKGLLTRDPRMKERRKPGLAQSARAKKQSPKR